MLVRGCEKLQDLQRLSLRSPGQTSLLLGIQKTSTKSLRLGRMLPSEVGPSFHLTCNQRKNAAYHFLNLAPFRVPIPAHCRLVGLPRQVQFMLSTRTRRPLLQLVSSKRNEIRNQKVIPCVRSLLVHQSSKASRNCLLNPPTATWKADRETLSFVRP